MSQAIELSVRSATVADVPILTTFNCQLAAETEDMALDPNVVRSGVSRGLMVGEEVQYFVAEHDGRVIGQLMLTREWSDWRDGWMAWLQSVYVAEKFRGQGVFRRLLDHVKDVLRTRGDVICLRLYVEDENTAALATYHRLGFKQPGYRVMEMPLR